MKPRYKNLCFSGGHVKAISLLGCVRKLEELGWLSGMNQYIGSSAGSIICLMLSLSMTYEDMKKVIKMLLMNEVLSIEVESILNIHETFGLDNGLGFVHVMKELLKERNVSPDITFIDLAKSTGKNLVICGSNITKKTLEFFSVDTFPQMKVLDALRISVSIPIIMQPVLYEECYYIDAGIFDNFPIHYFQHTQHLRDTLGISINTKEVPITNFLSYLYNIAHSLMDMTNMYMHSQAGIVDSNNYDVCTIDVEEKSFFCMETMQFQVEAERFDELVQTGYSSLENFLNSKMSA